MSRLWKEIEHTQWADALLPIRSQLNKIDAFLKQEEEAGVIHYPVVGSRLKALSATPLSDVKCVIVGQDPYPGKSGDTPYAMGLSFSVPLGAKRPPSLKNIEKELRHCGFAGIPEGGDLTPWARQGVLLLNSVMTLRAGESNSHVSLGWQTVTLAILRAVYEHRPDTVFLGLGLHAHRVYDKAGIPGSSQIKTSHPSPLGATKAAKDGSFVPFLGSGCFSLINQALQSRQNLPINWSS